MNYIQELRRIGFINIKYVEEVLNRAPHHEVFKVVDTAKQFITHVEENVNKLYFRFTPILNLIEVLYFDGIFIFSIPAYREIEELKPFDYQFQYTKKMYYEAYYKCKYSSIEMRVDKKFRALVYEIFYKKMPSNQKFYSFIDMYKQSENAMAFFSLDRIKEIFKAIPKELVEKRRNSNLVDKNGYIEVFRGQGSKSTSINKAISWTTDINTARFFANRFDNNGYIVRGKIHISKVIFYI